MPGRGRGKGVKRSLIPSESSDSSTDAEISSDGASSEGVCDICQERQPPPKSHRAVFGKAIVHWVGCDNCERWFHQCCRELDASVEVSTIVYKCFHCIPKVCTP